MSPKERGERVGVATFLESNPDWSLEGFFFSPLQVKEVLDRSLLLLAHVDWNEAVQPVPLSTAWEHRPLVKIDSENTSF